MVVWEDQKNVYLNSPQSEFSIFRRGDYVLVAGRCRRIAGWLELYYLDSGLKVEDECWNREMAEMTSANYWRTH